MRTMAGNPVYRRRSGAAGAIDPVYRRFAADVEKAGGPEAILDRIANGEFVTRIAKDFNVSPALIYKWIHETKERERAWEEAKKVSAHGHVEGGLERLTRLADMGATVTSAQVSAERALAEYRMKLAALRHPDYQEKKQTELNVNVGLAHLGALLELGNMDKVRGRLNAEPVPEADYEVEEECSTS